MPSDVQAFLYSINWPTLIVGVAVVVPITVALFRLIAGRSREDLVAERKAHEQTRVEKEELANEIHRLDEQNTELLVRLERHGQKSRWQDIDLTDEQKTVLIAIAKGEVNRLFSSGKISPQRIALAKDRLLELGLIGYGPESAYAKPAGRKWLDANGLLE